MKKRFMLLTIMMIAGVLAWADPVIQADADSVQFGQVDVGYPTTRTIKVSGSGLVGNINLAIEGRYADEFGVFPRTITPEDAAGGVVVKVKYSPRTKWSDMVNLVLTSDDAADVVIPVTSDPQQNATIYGYNGQLFYSTNVGNTTSSVEVAYFADVEVPTDPTVPMVSIPWNDDTFDSLEMDDFDANLIDSSYAISIEGDDCFSAAIVRSSFIANTCTVRINYNPTTCGTHQAVLNVTCSRAGVPLIAVQLNGESLPNADVDGDGDISIQDLSSLIDILLSM